MTADLEVALVSNRGPVSFRVSDEGFEKTRGAGGLAGALDPVMKRVGDRAVWICAATSRTDREAIRAGEAEHLEALLGYPVRMLTFEPQTYAEYYDVVSNRMLWFANHCLWDELHIRTFGENEIAAWENSYEPVNERFARAVAEKLGPGTLVLFQDYHLASAPGYLRKLRPDQTIFHFTHSSFCGPEGLERLPRPIPQRIIEGMLGADLVGFHVPAWCEAFYRCCERIGATVDRDAGRVHHGGRSSWVRDYPIPIDAGYLRERASKRKALRWAKHLEEWRGDSKLLVRADRAEPSKNIVRGFEAFGRMLDSDPNLGVKFVACLYPSRQSMPEYQRYTSEIQAIVDQVNERHPDSIKLFMKDDFDRTLGALRIYDALLVNPIMDGMNLVAKEGPALNENDGALILSPGAGAFEELGAEAVDIDDPLDVDGIAKAIDAAISMDLEERRKRAGALREIAASRQPEDWIESQLADLTEVRERREPITPPPRH